MLCEILLQLYFGIGYTCFHYLSNRWQRNKKGWQKFVWPFFRVAINWSVKSVIFCTSIWFIIVLFITKIIDRKYIYCEFSDFDLQKVGPKMIDSEGKEVPGNRGYKYFGAAKDLPGVRELFEQERKFWLLHSFHCLVYFMNCRKWFCFCCLLNGLVSMPPPLSNSPLSQLPTCHIWRTLIDSHIF